MPLFGNTTRVLVATAAAALATAACRTPAAKPPEPAKTVEAPKPAPVPVPAPAPAEVKPALPPPEIISPNEKGWWRDRVFYEIFVRSFADSNGDGIGDFKGLTAKLDYLNDGKPETTTDLGVTGIWLMPINPSPSYHGYDVTDYRGINPEYGTMADFEAFLAEAHKRGIRVIIDLVVNHTSTQHPWFKESIAQPDGPRRAWYNWRAENPGWRRLWDGAPLWHPLRGAHYYALFWDGMPDLNLANPAVEDEIVDIMRHWLAKKVDGFRLDGARHFFESADGEHIDVPENHPFLQRLRLRIHREHPEALFTGEVWSDLESVSEYYGRGDELQLAFAFTLAGGIRDTSNDGNKAELSNAILRTEKALAGKDRGFDAPFISNHDMKRFARDFRGELPKVRLAAATLFAMPGTPFLYYGEEIGMQGGGGPEDELKRTPMVWNAQEPGHGFTTAAKTWFRDVPEAPGVDVASQQKDPKSLWNLYRRLVALRAAQAPLALGETTRPKVEGGGRGAFAVLREKDGRRVLFVANYYTDPTGPFTVHVTGAPKVLEQEGLGDVPAQGGTALSFPGMNPQSFAYLALE